MELEWVKKCLLRIKRLNTFKKDIEVIKDSYWSKIDKEFKEEENTEEIFSAIKDLMKNFKTSLDENMNYNQKDKTVEFIGLRTMAEVTQQLLCSEDLLDILFKTIREYTLQEKKHGGATTKRVKSLVFSALLSECLSAIMSTIDSELEMLRLNVNRKSDIMDTILTKIDQEYPISNLSTSNSLITFLTSPNNSSILETLPELINNMANGLRRNELLLILENNLSDFRTEDREAKKSLIYATVLLQLISNYIHLSTLPKVILIKDREILDRTTELEKILSKELLGLNSQGENTSVVLSDSFVNNYISSLGKHNASSNNELELLENIDEIVKDVFLSTRLAIEEEVEKDGAVVYSQKLEVYINNKNLNIGNILEVFDESEDNLLIAIASVSMRIMKTIFIARHQLASADPAATTSQLYRISDEDRRIRTITFGLLEKINKLIGENEITDNIVNAIAKNRMMSMSNENASIWKIINPEGLVTSSGELGFNSYVLDASMIIASSLTSMAKEK